MLKLVVFISGGGTNLQALIDACREGKLAAEIRAVISNNSQAYGLARAKDAGISTYHISKIKYPNEDNYVCAIEETLEEAEADVIVLAGYMKLLPAVIVRKFHGRIINIHPALLPKYGGKGMYGINVHKAVLENSDRVSGATVHVVTEEYDRGPILIQRCVPVIEGYTPETLAARVLEVEHMILPEAVALFIR